MNRKETRNNKTRSKWLYLFILLAIGIFINILSRFPAAMEQYYYGKIYPSISQTLRTLTGWIPFSIGDVLYGLAGIWIIVRLFKTIRALVRKQVTKEKFLTSLKHSAIIALWIYIIFNLFWGCNYNRLGISYQLQLAPAEYSTEDLKNLASQILEKVNNSRRELQGTVIYPSSKDIFTIAIKAYDSAEKKYPFLHYNAHSVKQSVWGWLGNYTGFLGYYNPFTGESQVNTTIPDFLVPYTTCHEIAHQLGYASEDEANFTGYLAAISSSDIRFHYSAYFDLFNYANRELFTRDSIASKNNYKLLDTLVKEDIQTYRKFLAEHKNPVEPVIDNLYAKYLQANNQPKGLDTYDEVVSWLIAYEKKYGHL